ncbi:MAG TPA: (S)-ureidoglycine aminohydrolase [Verrucomicrobiae bacterium]|nr:(S)-ureidoglycine aminohydrolase [Verrucomicrobiae bacterium]
MSDLFGFTRTVVRLRYALLTPDGFVPSVLPGWKSAVVIVNISPALGARFTQLHVTLAADGAGEGNTGANQYFVYVIEGSGTVTLPDKRHRLEAGSYIYLPPGTDMQIKSSGATLRLLVFQKRCEPLPGAGKLAAIVGHEREVKGQPFLGNEDARLQVLLPDLPAFDLAVNIFTYQPGAMLPFVETHIMEHGLLMLKGQGVYRLDDDWHPVQAGDVIWMAPYCPQWFVAMGQTPASYIYYKDVNRDPM